MPEWLLGLITGVVAISIGSALTMLWDNYKFKRESKKKEEIVLSAVKEELIGNLKRLQNNRELIETELDSNHKVGMALPPLGFLQVGFWDVVKINLPQKLMETDILLKLREVALVTERINELVRSRENHRIHNRAIIRYVAILRGYDKMILSSATILEKSLKELQSML